MEDRLIFDKVPRSLAIKEQWVMWRTVNRDGNLDKLPFEASTGTMAKSNDPSTWTAFEHAAEVCREGRYDGIGFVFSERDGFCGVDLDGCRDSSTGEVAAWAKEIILQLDTYAEVSPSHTGVKLFLVGKSPFANGRKTSVDQPAIAKQKKPGIEIYDHLRYFAVTGMRLTGPHEPQGRQEELNQVCEEFFPAPIVHSASARHETSVQERAASYVSKVPPAISGSGGHNQAFHVACVLVIGFGLSPDESRSIFEQWNQTCQPPWNEREITHKLNSAASQPGPRNYLRDASREEIQYIEVPTYAEPERTNRITTLESSVKKYIGQLESGEHRLVELGIPDLDYAIGGGVEMGEMVVIGARPSHGKSVCGLQIAATATANDMPCLIISEEMSSLALGKRVLQFASDVPEEHWRHSIQEISSHVETHFETKARCYVVESCGTAENASKIIEHAVVRDGVKIIIVDYAQLLKGSGGNSYEQASNTSLTLRQLANRHGIVVVALCQLNRSIESRNKFVPKMADLKESGQWEQDADVILFSVWPHRLDSSKDPHEYFIFVAKNRNRAINANSVTCRFEPSRQRLVDQTPADRGTNVGAYDSFEFDN